MKMPVMLPRGDSPVTSVPMRLPRIRLLAAPLLRLIPLSRFPEMTLRALASCPADRIARHGHSGPHRHKVGEGDSCQLTFVPMRLPRIWFLPALLLRLIPLPRLPETTFPAPGTVLPMVLSLAPGGPCHRRPLDTDTEPGRISADEVAVDLVSRSRPR